MLRAIWMIGLTSAVMALGPGCLGTGAALGRSPAATARLEAIQLDEDGLHFIRSGSRERFFVWGVNYDRDDAGRLLEDYWIGEWATVEEDFREIVALGANVVRIHLQLGRFMAQPNAPDPLALAQLARLVRLAEQTGLYLNITGLGCYHRQDVPDWYDGLPEADRWAVQARFWAAIARTCAGSPAIMCYNLMNEPILPGRDPESDWLAGDLAGKHYVQRIALDLAGRTREQVAQAWIDRLVEAIREHDSRTLITVGAIPWAMVWPKAKPIFYDPEVARNLDFVSVHIYPKEGEVEQALAALAVYKLEKPLVIEEIFPLNCSIEQIETFIGRSRDRVDGYISFYWGKTIEEYAQEEGLTAAIMHSWLTWFREHATATGPGLDG